MQIKRATGPAGAARKYDLLTVLGTYALAQDKAFQRQILRLICLITARYNWQSDQLLVGQAEIARMWSVDIRTVKREIAALRARGWLVERRAAARGRVTMHGLGIDRILADTRPVWDRVGPDLVERLAAPQGPAEAPQDAGARVIPFPPAVPVPATGLWSEIASELLAENPSVYGAWFAGLSAEESTQELILRAPSGFHASYVRTHYSVRIEALLRRAAPGLRLVIAS